MRTGTLAPATLSRRSRRACMASERPKTTALGGISPRDCTSELTELGVVMDIIVAFDCLGSWATAFGVHPESQTVADYKHTPQIAIKCCCLQRVTRISLDSREEERTIELGLTCGLGRR